MIIYFDVKELYYLPQYTPVIQILKQRNCQVKLVVYSNPLVETVLDKTSLLSDSEMLKVNSEEQALSVYLEHKPDWVIFGNQFTGIKQLDDYQIKSAQLHHGIGPKDSYYNVSDCQMTVRFVESQYRYDMLKKRYPDSHFVITGFCKLDGVFNGTATAFPLATHGLDESKPTILYAPTFYPSSIERLSDNWPQELENYNLLIKPHYFSFQKKAYKNQRKKFERWAKYPNVYLAGTEHFSLVPFMANADILVSEASSSMFEFAALDKPIVWCDFYKLRWSYRGIFASRFKKRMATELTDYASLGAHVCKAKELSQVIIQQLNHPEQFSAKRKEYTANLVGEISGHASERVSDYLLNN